LTLYQIFYEESGDKEQRMHVLFATHQNVALHEGGVRTQMLQTKAALEEQGVTVTMFEMWKKFDSKEYDLVHIFSANMATYHFARILRTRNIPFVVSPVFYTRRSDRTVRSVIRIDTALNHLVRGFWTDYGLISEMCRWANAVLPNTQAEAHLMQYAMNVPSERLFIVINGVEERFAKAPSDLFIQQYGIKNFILYVGQIGPHRKNAHQMLNALKHIDHPAVIIGSFDDSPSSRKCLELAKKNPRLLIIDELPHDSMLLASAYSACDVFLLPSLYETPGISALEAGLAGAKIVITPYGGTRDYFGSDAIYVNPTSAADIAEGIRKALRRKKDSTLSKRIKRELTWQKVGEKTKQVYDHVLKSM
jgi:glycosyltransferase involved in cell wall biosynthesis